MNGMTKVKLRPAQEAKGKDGDRRRSGRVAYENPELVKMLRDPASTNAIGKGDDLRAAKGVLMALPVALGCWLAIGVAIWVL